MRKPNFLGIGAMKAATTWVWQQLADHPEVELLPPKEYHYFDNLLSSPEDYLQRFNLANPKMMTGEITPSYLTVPHAPLLAASICPEVKVLVILRNPVDRAYSHWKVSLWVEGKIPWGTSFLKAFKYGYPWGAYWHTISERGLYYKYLKRWYKSFPEKQIKVLWYDDLESDPLAFLRNLYGWLGLNKDFIPKNYKNKLNENWSKVKTKIKEVDRQHVLDHYLPSIEKLERFTGRDLRTWKI